MAAGLRDAIPFNKYLELEVAEVAPGRGVVRLPERPELLNHVGSQHAGALFSAGVGIRPRSRNRTSSLQVWRVCVAM